MSKDSSTTGASIEKYRVYLAFLVRTYVSKHLDAKVDLSGIVQQTMLEAHQNRHQWKPLPEEEQMAYLRRIAANNARDQARKYATGKRDVRREQSLDDDFERSSICLMNMAVADVPSPSIQLSKAERAIQLAAAMERLPDSQREALMLQYWEQMSLKEIADRMNRSPEAIAGLIRRGVRQLRQDMDNPSD